MAVVEYILLPGYFYVFRSPQEENSFYGQDDDKVIPDICYSLPFDAYLYEHYRNR